MNFDGDFVLEASDSDSVHRSKPSSTVRKHTSSDERGFEHHFVTCSNSVPTNSGEPNCKSTILGTIQSLGGSQKHEVEVAKLPRTLTYTHLPGDLLNVDLHNIPLHSFGQSQKTVPAPTQGNPDFDASLFSTSLQELEFPGQSKVASLIAKFNKAASPDNNNNILPRRIPFVGSLKGTHAVDMKPMEQLQITSNEKKNPCLSVTANNDNDRLSVGQDTTHTTIETVWLQYFSKNPSDATNKPFIASDMVASVRPHLVVDERKQSRKNDQRIDDCREKPKPTKIPVPYAKPLCPFSLDKRQTKDSSSLIFGVNKLGQEITRPFSPCVDMVPLKDLPSPFSGSISISMNTRLRKNLMSPMDKNYPAIRKYLEFGNMSVIEHLDISLDTSEQQVLGICEQNTPIPIKMIFDGLNAVQKVGEGVFGEVFLGFFNGHTRVFKIVPIEGDEPVNGEKQKTFSEVFPEIAISKQLSKLNSNGGYRGCLTDGFVQLHNTRLAKGCYPEALVTTWKSWDETNSSDNDCPEFSCQQLFLIFEFDYGGKDAESFTFKNARQAFCLVLQMIHILAVGECAMEFEHRDLHWGNILVRDTDSTTVSYTLQGKVIHVPSGGIKGCIIDFTIARIVNDQQSPVFLDLKDDDEQFLGAGDHQFDIYRMMRDCNRNDWALFCPKTNTYWIHYLADKLLNKGRYVESESVEHFFFVKQLHIIKDAIMRQDSCSKFITSPTCQDFKRSSTSSNTNMQIIDIH